MAEIFNFSGAHRRGSFLVYVNGIEVPVQAATVNYGVNSVPMANIVLPPDPELKRLGAEDRVPVQVFYLDDVYPTLEGKPADFRLIFDGEIKGWSYLSSRGGRSLTFTCQDSVNLLDTIYPEMLKSAGELADNMIGQNTGNNVPGVNLAATFPWSLFVYGPNMVSGESKPAKRPFDIVSNMLQSIVSRKAQQVLGSIPAAVFYTRQIRKANLLQRFVPSPILEHTVTTDKSTGIFPVWDAVANEQALNTIMRKISEYGNGLSLLGMIRSLFTGCYYELLSLPTPPIAQIQGDWALPDFGYVIGPPKTDSNGKPFEWQPNHLLSHITKPQWLFGIPPSCNVVFPSMVRELRYDEDYSAQPTRIFARDTTVTEITQSTSPVDKLMTYGHPEQVQQLLDTQSAYTAHSMHNLVVWPEEFFKGPNGAYVHIPSWYYLLNQAFESVETQEERQAREALAIINSTPPDEDITHVIQELQAQKALSNSITTKEEAIKYLEDKAIITISRQRRMNQALARQEYHRLRGSAKTGTVVMTFNPYIVPGFPAVIFDSLNSGQHLVAYIVSVSHTLTTKGMDTVAQFINAQTLEEFMDELFNARIGNTLYGVMEDLGAAPINPLPTVRDVIQRLPNAEEYFTTLLHHRTTYTDKKKTAAFDVTKAVNFVMASGLTFSFADVFTEKMKQLQSNRKKTDADYAQKIENDVSSYMQILRDTTNPTMSGPAGDAEYEAWLKDQEVIVRRAAEQDVLRQRLEEVRRGKVPYVTSDKLQSYETFVPSKAFATMFNDNFEAMKFVSRPICTLDEYITFRGDKGLRQKPIADNDAAQGKGAKFYEKILDLKSGPGETPVFDQENALVSPSIDTLADTRTDWETKLKNYKKRVLFGSPYFREK